MKKILLLLLAAVSLCACKKTPETISVPFEKMDYYFAAVEASVARKIVDQDTFDNLFGVAFTMGMQVETLDFGKEFVIGIINPPTDEKTTLTPVSLVKTGDGLVFTYSEQIGEKMGSTMKPSLVIRVDKQYDAPLQIIKIQK